MGKFQKIQRTLLLVRKQNKHNVVSSNFQAISKQLSVGRIRTHDGRCSPGNNEAPDLHLIYTAFTPVRTAGITKRLAVRIRTRTPRRENVQPRARAWTRAV
jgi:hypothetical protein